MLFIVRCFIDSNFGRICVSKFPNTFKGLLRREALESGRVLKKEKEKKTITVDSFAYSCSGKSSYCKIMVEVEKGLQVIPKVDRRIKVEQENCVKSSGTLARNEKLSG